MKKIPKEDTKMDAEIKISRFIKTERETEYGCVYRAFFEYKGRSAFLDVFLSNEYISEMHGVPDFVSEMCLDWAGENWPAE